MAAAPAVPIVDFSAYTRDQHDLDARTQVARQIDEAFRTVGFVYLRNHGVPREQVERCFEWVRSPIAYIHIYVYPGYHIATSHKKLHTSHPTPQQTSRQNPH